MLIGLLVAKFLLGGTLVCAFALICQACAPKRFAGLFSSAPSVLTAGLMVTLIGEGVARAQVTAAGAVAGGVGLVAFCLVAPRAIRRFHALRGSLVATLPWLAVSAITYAVVRAITGG